MNKTSYHTYQILTKRSARLVETAPELTWSPNIWEGVSVEDERVLYRITNLKKVPATVRFISFEPLIGPIPTLDLKGIHWVIVGGESGPGARPIKAQWVRDIRDMCLEQGVPFFFKQWGGVRKRLAGRTLDGKIWDQYPEVETA